MNTYSLTINPRSTWAESARQSKVSVRELEVLICHTEGKRNKEIAESLGIKYQTVKNMLHSVTRKLNAKSNAQALMYTIADNLIRVNISQKGEIDHTDKIMSVVEEVRNNKSAKYGALIRSLEKMDEERRVLDMKRLLGSLEAEMSNTKEVIKSMEKSLGMVGQKEPIIPQIESGNALAECLKPLQKSDGVDEHNKKVTTRVRNIDTKNLSHIIYALEKASRKEKVWELKRTIESLDTEMNNIRENIYNIEKDLGMVGHT